MMENRRFYRLLIPYAGLYLWIIVFFIIAMAFYNYWISIAGLVVFCYLLYYNARKKYITTREITKYIENLTFHVDSATKGTLLNFPLPMVVLQLNGNITWYNSSFAGIFDGQSLFEMPIKSFVEELDIPKIVAKQKDKSISLDIWYKEKYYNIIANIISTESIPGSDRFMLMYWIDNTELHNLKTQHYNEKMVSSIIMIDNYEEVMQSTDDANRPLITAEIERKLTNWVSLTGGLFKKIERDKYVFIFQNHNIKKFEEKKFDVLDQIREINADNNIPVTLSIGIGINGENYFQNDIYAKAAIDIALGRGGDQVVIKDGVNLRFFGGKTKEFEKRTKVKARVAAYALRELISQSDHVIIMGHQNADIDSVGAAIGLCKGTRIKNKQAYILLGSYNPSVSNLLSKFQKLEEFQDVFINKNRALALMTSNTLLIVVDTHRISFVEYPELLYKTEQIVVIDHHRRGAEFIENSVLLYHEPYASSTCEMVTEILQYLDEKIKLSPAEAEALYAGITVDTKSFSVKTGVRTFEAASYLRRAGADPVSVKQLFQNDLESYVARAEIVKTAKIYKGSIAISHARGNIKNVKLIIAQAADDLLNISGVMASFVLCDVDEQIILSGRSFGDINVQVILEKLGGGGHLTVAGAQLADTSIEKAQKKLLETIDEYFEQAGKK